MTRYLLIDTDGETIAATLSMTEEDALLNVKTGQSLVALDATTDTGALIDDGVVKYSEANGIVLIADGSAVSTFDGVVLEPVDP